MAINFNEVDALGIDVSWHNGDINWRKVSQANVNGRPVSFAYIKATQGQVYSKVDYFRNNAPKAMGVDLDVGAYHYFDGCTVPEAIVQMKYFLSVIKDYKLTLPPVLDLEENKKKVSKKQLTDCVIVFLDGLLHAGYDDPILYTGDNFLDTCLDEARLAPYKKWIARYGPNPKNKFDIWQYTSTGHVDGVSGDVDIDIVYSEFLTKKEPTHKVDCIVQFWQAKALVSEFEEKGFKCQGIAHKKYGPGQKPANNDAYTFRIFGSFEQAKAIVIDLKTRGYKDTKGSYI